MKINSNEQNNYHLFCVRELVFFCCLAEQKNEIGENMMHS